MKDLVNLPEGHETQGTLRTAGPVSFHWPGALTRELAHSVACYKFWYQACGPGECHHWLMAQVGLEPLGPRLYCLARGTLNSLSGT